MGRSKYSTYRILLARPHYDDRISLICVITKLDSWKQHHIANFMQIGYTLTSKDQSIPTERGTQLREALRASNSATIDMPTDITKTKEWIENKVREVYGDGWWIHIDFINSK